MTLSMLKVAVIVVVLVLATGLVRWAKQRNTIRSALPPGPAESSFILGNVSDVPPSPDQWKKYREMSKRFGSVMHLRTFDKHLIILDTMKAAVDLLGKRGATYSNRPRLPFLGELMGYDWNMSIMPYGNFWRTHRRAFHQHMNEAAVARLSRKQERLNARFLKALVDTPGDWWSLTHWLAGANIMSTVYGLEDTQLKHDPWIQLGEDTLQIANEVFKAGVYAVDIFPILKYIPSWFPGASFKRRANKAYKLQIRAKENPYAWVKDQMAAGTAVPSITTALIDAEVDGSCLPEEVIKNCTGIAYIAGADTTLSIIQSFFMALVHNPSVQRKAQEELDRTIPADRLPTFADRDNSKLPYVEALLRETYRRYPPVPLGLPHTSIQEDDYEGMRIPAGATLVPNIWSMTRDEEIFPDPSSFRPERFIKGGLLDKDVLDPRNIIFGFGRRICPGRYFADAEIWLMMATVLYCFDIFPALDDHGNSVLPGEEVTDGIVVAPVQFNCRILSRSAMKESLILHNFEQSL